MHPTLDVLDQLLRKDLLWPGNIRQLQALAKSVARSLSFKPPKDDWYIVTKSLFEEGLEEIALVAEKGARK